MPKRYAVNKLICFFEEGLRTFQALKGWLKILKIVLWKKNFHIKNYSWCYIFYDILSMELLDLKKNYR